MRKVHEESGSSARRFVVVIDALQLRSGSYGAGDVVTGPMLGADAPRLLELNAVREGDFDLDALFDDFEDAPRE